MIYKQFQDIRLSALGLGAMRLPVLEGKDAQIDEPAAQEMVDYAMEHGVNYYDTAWGYHSGQSELAMGRALAKYPRESFYLATKFPGYDLNNMGKVEEIFEEQLKKCQVDYFDFYLMHAQSVENFEHFKKCRAYETALELKAEGKIRHFGISFHDRAAVLEKILTEYPQIEAVQIQFNYVDYDDPAVESRKCYEACRRFHKPVIVMEPVKGGKLAAVPEEAVTRLQWA